MRTIPINLLELPEGWADKAQALIESMQEKTEAERKEIINGNSIWQELLVALKKLSNGKCWYSEAQEVMSDLDVDHFRPKSEALNLDNLKREGYWWLAFDWENYRLSSIYSNRKRKDKHTEEDLSYGKGSFFPLRENCRAATCKAELDDEVFYLLDPVNPDDPDLLHFNDEGKAVPSITEDDQPWEFQRAKISIDLYHLNHTPLREARQVVWNLCQRKIDEIKTIGKKEYRSASDNARVQRIREELREMTSKKSEFSAVALACIEQNKLRMAA